jgi:predicted ATPase
VLTARASELERTFPFGVVHQLLDPVLRTAGPDEREHLMGAGAALAQPVFEPSPVVAETFKDPSHTVLHALYWLIANSADRGPLFLAVDDAHWIDRPSGRLLEFLVPRLGDLPVALVVAARSEGETATSPVSALARAPVERIALRPLSEAAIGELVARRLGRDAKATLSEPCATATGGNPFLVHELLDGLARHTVGPHGLDPSLVRSIGPREVAAAALARVAPVANAVEVAEAVAVLGDHAGLGPTAALAGLDRDEAAATADGWRRR